MKKNLLLLSLLASSLSANDSTTSLPDRWNISAGAYVIADHETLFNVNDHNGVSGSIDLQKVLNMQTETVSLYFDGYYRFAQNHRVEVGYTSLKSSGNSTSGKLFFPGEEYQIDLRGNVDTNLNIDTFKLLYTYSFYRNTKVELGLSLGLHVTKIDFGLGASIGTSTTDFSLDIIPPLPVVGARFEYNITPEWSVIYNFDLLYLATDVNFPNMPNIEGISGYLYDNSLATEYRVFNNFSIGVGINSSTLKFDFIEPVINVGIENNVIGVVGYGALHF